MEEEGRTKGRGLSVRMRVASYARLSWRQKQFFSEPFSCSSAVLKQRHLRARFSEGLSNSPASVERFSGFQASHPDGLPFGFKPKTIRRWVSRRLLNYIRVGNQFRFRAVAVELFLAQREVRK